MVEEKSVIDLANERVTIIEACNMLGMGVMDFSIASLKVWCPFGHLYHADGGTTKAMRIYPATNSAWCFACNIYFTPVKLIAMDRGIPDVQAAESILESTNYVPPDFEARWNALIEAKPTVNTDDLAEALKVACSRMVPDWDERQFDESVAYKLRQCLALLRKVKSDEDATLWLSITKKIMHRTLGETS